MVMEVVGRTERLVDIAAEVVHLGAMGSLDQ
jgi:hypothetical protein